MPLGGLHAGVPQQNRHLINRDACQQEFYGKGVPEHVGVRSFFQFCPLEQALQTGVPAIARAIMQPIPSPEEVPRVAVRQCAQQLDDVRRQGYVYRQPGFLLVQK